MVNIGAPRGIDCAAISGVPAHGSWHGRAEVEVPWSREKAGGQGAREFGLADHLASTFAEGWAVRPTGAKVITNDVGGGTAEGTWILTRKI